MDLVIQCVISKYVDFSTRASRKEYWLFVLFCSILYVVAAVIDVVTGLFDPEAGIGVFTGILALVLLLPSISVLVRRLHDTDRRGWWALIILVPIIGTIVLLVFACINGTAGENRFGVIWEMSVEGTQLSQEL